MSHISMLEEEIRLRNEEFHSHLRPNGTIYDFYYRTPKGPKRRISRVATPCSKRISFAPDLVAGIEEEDNVKVLEDLIHRPWTVYRASPLFLPKDVTDINGFYESLSVRLGQFLSYAKSYRVEIGPVNGLRGSREDSTALKVSVRRSLHDRVQEKPICVCYLIGVDTREIQLKSRTELLPVLLASGRQNVIEDVNIGLQKAFDCVISRVSFSNDDCRWMLALWSGIESEVEGSVVLDFNHSAMKGIDVLQISLNASKIRELWKKVHNESETEFTLKEVTMFYDSLYQHLTTIYGIKFDEMTLNQFVLPILSVNRKGSIDIRDKKHVKTILRYLTDLCQGTLFSTNPRLGIEVETLGF